MIDTKLTKHLVQKISQDDSDAFRMFFNLYFKKINQFAGYYLKTSEIREEAVSDVFMNIWNNRKKLVFVENIESYLYTITKNKCFDYIDKLSREPSFTYDLSLEIRSKNSNPEDVLLNKELEKVINASIEELPPRCKVIFMMAREDGLKYREIANILSISEKTINAQMVTAIKKIADSVKKYLLLF